MQQLVTTTHLEMNDRAELRPVSRSGRVAFSQAEVPCPELNRFLYATVGARWIWYQRLSWDYLRWHAYLDRPELETWLALSRGTLAGYFELEEQGEGSVEIAYFGLMPQFIGCGLGGEVLTAAIERAWEMGGQRVWVHTCTLDHPRALPAYQARGFKIFRVVEEVEELPNEPLEPWPGANPVTSVRK